MKPIFTFLASFGFSLILNSISAQATHNLTWGLGSTNQLKTIEVGDTVRWTWDSSGHDLVQLSGPESGFGNSALSSSGHVYSHTFTTVGVNTYKCTPHSSQMYGTITVTPSAPTGDPIQSICRGESVQSVGSDIDINTETGASISWYNSISSSSPLSASTLLEVGDNTYYISQTVNGIESTNRFEIRTLIPDLYLTYDNDICPGTSTDITFNNDVGEVPGAITSIQWQTGESNAAITVTPISFLPNIPVSYIMSYNYDSGLAGVDLLQCVLTAAIFSRDTTGPTFTTSPANVTVECSASSAPSATGTAAASDNCDTSVTVAYADSTAAGTGNNSVITRVWTATDDNGNASTYTQTITVVDTTDPTFTTSPANVTVECSASSAPSATGTAAASDNCDTSVTVAYADSTAAGTGNNSVITRVWTATDDNSNSTTYTQTITVVDTTDPTFTTSPANVTVECSASSAPSATGTAAASDNCDTSVTVAYADSTAAGTGNNSVITRVWTATDDNSNSTTYTQTITVVDTTDPTFTTSPANVTVECSASSAPSATGTAAASDNCDTSVTVAYADSTAAGTGNNSVITRVWTATDDNSNSTTYTQTITVVDTTDPTFTTSPANVTVECSASSAPSATGTAAASDNCDTSVTVAYADSTAAGTGNNSVITRVWTATDDNSNSTTYTQTITVVDTTDPTFTTSPANVTVECSASSAPSATGTAAASDNCDTSVTVAYADSTAAGTGNNSVITRVWTATDDNSNSTTYTQTITVVDTTDPTFTTSPANVTVECSASSAPSATGTAAASDNCDTSVTVAYADSTAAGTGNNSVITRVWTATDDNSNSTTYTQTITVVDTTDPTFTTSPASVTVECSASSAPSATGTAAASDNCDTSVTVAYADSTAAGTGNNSVITRVWTATDDNSNSTTYTQTITVVDTTDPTFTTSPANVTVECDAATTTSALGTAAASDNCDTSVTVAYADSTAAGTGNNSVITRVWTATDDNSNSTTYTQTITVVDTTDPVADVASLADVTSECSVDTLTAPTATDNCAGSINGIITEISAYLNWNINEPNNVDGLENYGMILDNGKWNDHRGDNSNPDFIMESDYDLGLISGFNFIGSYNGHYYYQSTSNHNWNSANNIAVSNGGYLLIITSQGENEFIQQNAIITIHGSWIGMYQDTSNSSYSEPAGGWYWVNGSEVYRSINNVLPITDQGTTVVTWTYEDDNGNISTQTQNVVINDATAPVADLASLVDVTAGCSVDTLTAPTATDNCAGSITGTTTTVLPITDQGTTVVTWTYEDNEGNITTQTQTVVVIDTTAPVADLVTLTDVTAECSVDTLTVPTATDNCAGSITGTTTTVLPITDQGTTVVTWTYEDNEGNITTQTQTVVVIDTTAPVADLATLTDVTAQCSVDSLTAPTATDNCSGSITGTTTTVLPITAQGITVVTWTYEDANGNISTQSQNIVIEDTTDPVADLATLTDVTAQCSVDALTAPTATDNCSGSITGTTTTSLPITAQGITVVTWTYEDANGNITTQSQNIVINDVTAPAFTTSPASVTVECSASSAPSATGTAAASDNCDTSVTVAYADSTAAGVGNNSVITRVWTATDVNGNTSTYTQTITVVDTTAPVADIATLSDVTAQCSVDALTAPTATDNCAGSITGITTTVLPITAQGTTVVTWTYEDANGNISTQTQNVVIEDTTIPVVDGADFEDVIAECSVDALTAPTATDNCSGIITGTTTTTFPITAQGTTVVTWIFEENNGNISTQNQNVVIEDTTDPVADLATLTDVTAQCSVDALTAPTATDNCSGSITGTTTTSLPITAQGITVVTWTYEDANGNITTQNQNVVIEDTTDPVADLATLTDVTAQCSVDALTAPTATDNCSGSITGTTTTSLPITAQGITVVTWTYEDANGNITTQSQNIVIEDTTDPVADLATLTDVTAQCSVDALTAPTATDNCSGSITGTTTTSLPITAQGITVVTWTYEDANGNITTQSQNIVINDVTAPAFTTSPASVTVECSASSAPSATGTAAASDNCDTSVTVAYADSTAAGVGNNSVITRVWTATDVNGNTSTYTQTITVVDTTAPVADIATLSDVTAQCSVDALTAPTATDNCAGSITGITTTVLPITAQGTTVVTWTYEDANGNISTQTQNVVIEDTTIPVVDGADFEDVIAECSVDALTAPTATDNCSGIITGTTTTTFPITAQGTTVVTWIFEENNGNISTQNQNVVIEDTTDPVADLATLTDVTAQCSVDALTAPTATDNCSGSITGTTTTSLPITAQGITVVTWTYEDANGNITTQNQNVVIEDTTDPVADLATLTDVTAQCSVDALTAPTATDNCSGSITGTTTTSLPITAQGITVVTWTYEDANGNITTQSQNIVIDDVTAPAFTTSPASVTVECSASSAPSATGTAAASDNCDTSVTVAYADSTAAGVGNNSVITRVWTATDVNGNTSTYTQTITVVDTTAPVADLATLTDVTAQCSVDALTAPTATDNCAGSITGITTTVLPITAQGTTVVTWTYEDANGNISTQSQNIVIEDTTIPVVDGADFEDVIAECSVDALTAPTATDNCSGSITGTTTTSLPITAQGITVVTWTYEDANGNITTQNQNVVIEDTTDPVADLATLTDVTAQCSVDSLTAPTATDNCSGSITGTTTTVLPITAQGITVVTWTYEDANGNISTQSQNIVIEDTTDPVADLATLTDVTAQCSVDALTAPTATDNCSGSITGTTTTSLPITAQGITVVTWTYEDANGNITTQSQNIVINDVTAPAFTTSPASVTVECSASSAPSATGTAAASDNCDTSVTVAYADSTAAGVGNNSVITRVWTATDVNGNTSTYTQTITVVDTTAPVVDIATLSDVTAQCSVDALTAPTATDNCAGSITGITTTVLPITAQGTTVVTWTYEDANGNISTQTQNVVIERTENLDTLEDNYIICNDLDNGGLGYIILSPEIADPDYTFIWRDDFGNILSQQSTYQITEGGVYSLEIYYPGCTTIIELFTVTEIETITATIEITTEDFSINNVVVITPTSNGNYEFSLDQGIWQDNNTFTNVSSGIHTIDIQDKRGCELKTYIIYIIDYPRFFTPNGDGYNDNWNIDALSNQTESRINIFDRFGKLITQIRPAGIGWDGTYNGEMMPTNDYWFALYYNDLNTGEPKEFRSHFTLKR